MTISARLRLAGFDAFLIGEQLMKSADPAAHLRELIRLCRARILRRRVKRGLSVHGQGESENLRDHELDRRAASAVEAGADFLGFNFYAGSPRYITPAKARHIVRRLPKGIAAVGVFVNETEAKMLEIARAVGLDYLQLHGDESPEIGRAPAAHLPGD